MSEEGVSGRKMRPKAVWVQPELHKALKIVAVKRGQSLQELAESIFLQVLTGPEGEGGSSEAAA